MEAAGTGVEATGPVSMIRIAITVEAFEAIVATLGPGSVGYEPQTNAKGERLIWLEEVWISKLTALRRPSESYSDVILRLVSGRLAFYRSGDFSTSLRRSSASSSSSFKSAM